MSRNRFIIVMVMAFSISATVAPGCNRFVQGKRIYTAYCVNCHMADGSGLGELIPSLESSEVLKRSLSEAACIIYNGIDTIGSGDNLIAMPAFPEIEPVELSNLLNYVNSEWGSGLEATNPAEIETAIDECRNDGYTR